MTKRRQTASKKLVRCVSRVAFVCAGSSYIFEPGKLWKAEFDGSKGDLKPQKSVSKNRKRLLSWRERRTRNLLATYVGEMLLATKNCSNIVRFLR